MAHGLLAFVAPSVLLTLEVVGFLTFLVTRWVKKEIIKNPSNAEEMEMNIEQLAGARNQTLFEFIEECYRRKWGVPPLKRTLEDDLSRYKIRGSIPRYVSDLFPPDFVLPAYAITR